MKERVKSILQRIKRKTVDEWRIGANYEDQEIVPIDHSAMPQSLFWIIRWVAISMLVFGFPFLIMSFDDTIRIYVVTVIVFWLNEKIRKKVG